MAEKLTNKEVLEEIATMSTEDANKYGITPDQQEAFGRVASGNEALRAAVTTPATPLYNAFCGFVVKYAASVLSKAKYRDVYGRHHRNMLDGRPELGFVGPAKEGTGNRIVRPGTSPTAAETRTLTSVITAEMPDIVALYDITIRSYVARVPISAEQVKTAFAGGLASYGITELYLKVKEGLEDTITEDLNVDYDGFFLDAFINAIPVGTGNTVAANASKAMKDVTATTTVVAAVNADDYSLISEDDLVKILVKIKHLFYRLTGRPVTTYNALAVKNNVDKDQLVCYIDSDVYTEMSRVKATLFDAAQLEADGLRFEPIKAPWLCGDLEQIDCCVAAIGSDDWIRDWPTNDFGDAVHVETGEIMSRHKSVEVARCGYEPFVFLYEAE